MALSKSSATSLLLAASVVLAASACGPDDGAGSSTGATMRPGENCLSCHSNFTLAGTVYAADTLLGVGGVDVAVTDGGGVHHYTSNSAGNFFTTDPLSALLGISVTRGSGVSSMSSVNSATGACNSCHDAGMRITVP